MTYTNSTFEGHAFKFVVDICSNLSPESGATCIGDAAAERAALKTITLLTKISTQFFSPATYLAGDSDLQPTFATYSIPLSSSMANE